MQGRLVVFEGSEGAGKTTQIQKSCSWLQSDPWIQTLAPNIWTQITATREPGGTLVGQEVRQLLLAVREQEPITSRTELLLYAADRAQHVEQCLQPALARGELILCDRFKASTIAYQGYGRGLDMALIHQLNQIATAGLESDLTIWLDVEVETGLARTHQRGGADRMEQSGLEFHRRVRQGFKELHQQNPERMVRIDASGSEEQVFEQVQAVLRQWMREWVG
jgi:dTMP kinase